MALLARGLITAPEASRLAGVSRQLMAAWIKAAGIEHERVRQSLIARHWRKGMRHGPKLVEVENPKTV